MVHGLQLVQDLDPSDLRSQELQQVKVQLRGPGRLQQETDQLNQQADAVRGNGVTREAGRACVGARSAELWKQQQQRQSKSGRSTGVSSIAKRSKVHRNGFWTVPLHYAASTPVDAKWQPAHSTGCPAAAGGSGGGSSAYPGSETGMPADYGEVDFGHGRGRGGVHSTKQHVGVASKVTGSLAELLLLAEVAEAAAAAESEEQSSGSEQCQELAGMVAAPTVGAATSPSPAAAPAAANDIGREEATLGLGSGTVVEVQWLIPPGAEVSLTPAPGAPAKLLQDQQQLRLYRRHQQLFRSMSPSLRRAAGNKGSSHNLTAGFRRSTITTAASAPAPSVSLGHAGGLACKGPRTAASEAGSLQLTAASGAGEVTWSEGSIGLRGGSREGMGQGLRAVGITAPAGMGGKCNVSGATVRAACQLGPLYKEKQQQHEEKGKQGQQQQQELEQRQVLVKAEEKDQGLQVMCEQGKQREQPKQHQQQHSVVPLLPLKRRWPSPNDQGRSSSLSTVEVLAGRWGTSEDEDKGEGVQLKKQRLQEEYNEQKERQQQHEEGRQQGSGGAGQWRAIEQAVADAVQHSSRMRREERHQSLAMVRCFTGSEGGAGGADLATSLHQNPH